MKIDWNPNAVKQLQEQALTVLAQSIREQLELVYCEEHGHFVEQIELVPQGDKLEARYETCCDAQRKEVELLLQGGF